MIKYCERWLTEYNTLLMKSFVSVELYTFYFTLLSHILYIYIRNFILDRIYFTSVLKKFW